MFRSASVNKGPPQFCESVSDHMQTQIQVKNPDGSRSPPVDFAFSGQSRSVIAQDNNQVSTSRQSLQEADGLVTQRWISRAVKLYKWFRSCPNRALTIVRYIDLNVPGRAMPVTSRVGRAGKSQADNLFRPRPQSECQLSRARAYIVVFSKQRGGVCLKNKGPPYFWK